MEQELWPNHRGVFVIKAPSDMPIALIAMLQASVGEAWVHYDGDPNNAEQFWNHLVAGGMADVPRETSPHRHEHRIVASWPTGPDGESDSLMVCHCGDQITERST